MKKLFSFGSRAEDIKNSAKQPNSGGTLPTGADLMEAIQVHYTGVAERGSSCCGDGSSACGGSSPLYSAEELENVTPEAAGASAGCGNPMGLAEAKPGETVLDLGSGGGIDCFLASKAVGHEGSVIGVDMTHAMVALARQNAAKLGVENVTFKLGTIEAIPEPDNTVDLVISNCVIALAPDKDLVFSEIFRVLKPGGRLVVSDMVVDQELPEDVRQSAADWVSCVAGADLKARYLERIGNAGFENVELLADTAASGSSCGSSDNEVRSVTVRAVKPGA